MDLPNPNPWLSERDLQPTGAVRLFCLPHAGSGAAGFFRWKRRLPSEIQVCPLLLPGRERRIGEPARTNAVALAAQLLHATAPLLATPYAVFGHSMGSLIAYEWLRQIRAAGLPSPAWFFASGRNAPHRIPPRAPLHGLPEADFLNALRARFGGGPDDLLADPEQRAIFLPILRADLELVETYQPALTPQLDCPLAASAGADDTSVTPAGLRAWHELTGARFREEIYPGDHFYHLGPGQTPLLHTIATLLTT